MRFVPSMMMMSSICTMVLLLLLFSTNTAQAQQELDCSFHGNGYALDDNGLLSLRHVIHSDNSLLLLSLELTYNGLGWIGFGFSTENRMAPNIAMIGLPNDNIVTPYNLTSSAFDGSGVNAIVVEDDTTVAAMMTNASIVQNETHTIMTFTQSLEENDESLLLFTPNAENSFIWAVGTENELEYHAARGFNTLTFDTECQVVVVVGQEDGDTTTTTTDNNNNNNNNETTAATQNDATTATQNDATTAIQDDATTTTTTTIDTTSTNNNSNNGTSTITTNTTTALPFEGSFVLADGDIDLYVTTNPTDETITVQMTYAGLAWISLAFSNDNRMKDSTAVIGVAGASVEKYDMTGTSLAAVNRVTDPTRQTLQKASFVQNTTHSILTFTKFIKEPNEIEIRLNQENMFLYAIGYDSATLGYHQKKGSFPLNLSACTTADCDDGSNTSINEQASVDTLTLWRVHGLCMALAWAILVPLAIASSLLRNFLPPSGGLWFQAHRGLNMLGIVLTIVGFAIAVKAMNKEGETKHFSEETHHIIGLIVFLLSLLQAISGILRPHAPAAAAAAATAAPAAELVKNGSDDLEDEKNKVVSKIDDDDASDEEHHHHVSTEKTTVRLAWEIGHRLMGIITLVLGWYNCHSGIELYAERYTDDPTGALWGIIGAISGVTVLGVIVTKMQQQS